VHRCPNKRSAAQSRLPHGRRRIQPILRPVTTAVIAAGLLAGCDQPNGGITSPSIYGTTSPSSTETAGCTPASRSNHATAPGSEQPDWPPDDTCGKFVPAPELLYAPFDAQGCGGTVTVVGGDPQIQKLEFRASVRSDGSTFVDYRGRNTVDVMRDYGGGLDAFVDELDVSGTGYDLYTQDGLSITSSRQGPSIFMATGPVEAQAFSAAKLPKLFYFEGGTVTERVVLTARNSDTTEVISAVITENSAVGVRSICYLLDPAKPGE
jgi:hypothetical protein